MSKDERVFVSYEQALKMLKPKGDIHTFRSGPGILIGAHWSRKDLKAALKAAKEIEVTGPQAQALNHGLAIFDKHGPLFIETVKREENRAETKQAVAGHDVPL